MNNHEAKKLEKHELRRIASAAECDPRSVVRYLTNKPMQPLVRQRIERCLDAVAGKISPPAAPPAATIASTPMVNGEMLALTHRQTIALESIAASLEKLANPCLCEQVAQALPPEVDE